MLWKFRDGIILGPGVIVLTCIATDIRTGRQTNTQTDTTENNITLVARVVTGEAF